MTHFSAVMRGFSCSILLAGVSACTYLIPDDVSAPRYNIVQGDRHKPMRNSNVPQNTTTPQNGASLQGAPANAQMAVQAAPVVPVAVNPIAVPIPTSMQYPQFAPVVVPTITPAPVARNGAFPPVDPSVEAKAKQLSANDNTVPSPVYQSTALRQMPLENPGNVTTASATSRIRPIENSATNLVAVNNVSIRRNPIENGTFIMAQNNAAPQGLLHVPARPVMTGPDSAPARLGEIRKDLEETRTQSTGARDQLTRDVAAEPSVFTKPAISPAAPEALSPLPASVAPLAAPAGPVPTPVMVPSSPVPPSVTPPVRPAAPEATRVAPAPVASFIAPVPVTLPPPPAPMMPMPVMAKAPTASGLAPIQLKNPAPIEIAAAAPLPVAAVKPTGRGFDPMAALPVAAPAAPALAPIMLTPPAARVEQPVVVQVPTPAPAPSVVASSSAFNPLDSDADSGTVRAPQYLTPSRYSYRR